MFEEEEQGSQANEIFLGKGLVFWHWLSLMQLLYIAQLVMPLLLKLETLLDWTTHMVSPEPKLGSESAGGILSHLWVIADNYSISCSTDEIMVLAWGGWGCLANCLQIGSQYCCSQGCWGVARADWPPCFPCWKRTCKSQQDSKMLKIEPSLLPSLPLKNGPKF